MIEEELSYLKRAMRAKCYERKHWAICAFSRVAEGPDDWKKDPYPYRIVQTTLGRFFVNEKQELEPLVSTEPITSPVFNFALRLTVDSSFVPNALQPVETSIGTMLFNLICIVNAFGTKVPYIPGKIDIGKIENTIIAPKLRDTPKEGEQRRQDVLYVDELYRWERGLKFMEDFSQLCVWAATEKTMTPAPGLDEFKAQLLKKYEGKLHNPVEFAKFEKELQDFDNAYLAGDPTVGVFMSGKIRDIARKKIFLTLGAEEGFNTNLEVTPITNSLHEGWSTDPVQFTAMMNGLRAGSYARGADTVKGGVSAKIILRAASNYKIVDTDCGTKLGLHRTYTPDLISKLTGRSVWDGKQWKDVNTPEEAKLYEGQPIVVRSIQYCKLEGDNICKSCAGKNLSENPVGLSTALTEISNIILYAFMKKMHGRVLAVERYVCETALS